MFDFSHQKDKPMSNRVHHLPSLVDVPEIPQALWEQTDNENMLVKLLSATYMTLDDFKRYIRLRNDKDTEPCQRVLQMLHIENY